MLHSLVEVEAAGECAQEKSGLKISAEGGASPSWEGGRVPSSTLRLPGEMLGGV